MKQLNGILALGSVLLGAGCTPVADLTTDLKPAPTANEAARLDEAAVDRVQGVDVIAQTGEWPGSQLIQAEVTPVRVVIDNRSKMPLRLRYGDFALVADDGAYYAALPLYRIEGSVKAPVLIGGYTPIADPELIYSNFMIAPLYHPAYPTLVSYPGTFAYDPSYYETYATYWTMLPLPTEEMFERALPEGVLGTGGHLEGYLYFEHIPEGHSRVTFRANLVNARNNYVFGEVRIPFIVQ